MKSYLSLEKSYMEFNSTIQDIDLQNKVSRTTDERHYNPCAGAMPIVEEDFWKLGNEESSVESDDSSFVSPLPSTDGPNNGRNHEDMNGLQISIDGSFEVSTNQEIGDSEIPERTGPDDSSAIRLELNYDPNTDSFEMMHDILVKIQCPLLDASFINKEDARKLLSQDRLGVSRSIMTTLYQCLNYWYVPNTSSSSTRRLKWSLLSAKEYDQMLIFFSYHQQTRLSLMLSDLNLLKSLPLFETFAGTHISIQDGDSNFTTDASMDLNSVSTYIPLTLQSKILRQKPELKDLYEDLNVSVLNEAAIIEKFILKEFETMPLNQKEAVIKVSSFILNIFPF
jgi:hypothetical protein